MSAVRPPARPAAGPPACPPAALQTTTDDRRQTPIDTSEQNNIDLLGGPVTNKQEHKQTTKKQAQTNLN